MNTTFTDYYAVLGVSPDADIDAIKTAYRRLAMQYHPDRGGSHEKMLLINEAFHLLVNPASRAEYDLGRNDRADGQAQDAAREAMHTAAQQASDYPPHSEDIDSWMDSVAKDFLSASYGKTTWRGVTVPTIDNSSSGVVFLIIGGIAGAIGAVVVGFGFLGLKAPVLRFALIFGAVGGAWVAQLLHRGIRDSMSGTNSSSLPKEAPADQHVSKYDYINCRKCGQQLRYALNTGPRTLRCPKCRAEFPSTEQPVSETAPEVTSSSAHAHGSSGMGWGVAVAIVAAMFLHTTCTTTYSGGLFGEPTTETNWFGVLAGTAICFVVAKSVATKAQ